jgi:hypothetical protein
MRACSVHDWILDEVESRDPDRVEREMVCPARIAVLDCDNAEVPEWPQRLLEDWNHLFVRLIPDPANPTGAVIDVQVRGNPIVKLGVILHPAT